MIHYAEHWKRGYLKPGPPLTEAEAARRHQAGETYTVLLGDDPAAPAAAVEVTPSVGVVTVLFLDAARRVELSYVFATPAGSPAGRVFLEQVHAFGYGPDDAYGDNPAQDSTYFKVDGAWHAERRNDGVLEVADGTAPPEAIAANWEPLPAFGDYTSIARRER